jgi:hypothetical protein
LSGSGGKAATVGEGEAAASGETVALTSAVCEVAFCGAGDPQPANKQAANKVDADKKNDSTKREQKTFICFSYEDKFLRLVRKF